SAGLRLLGSFEFHGGRDTYHFSIDWRTMALYQREAYGLLEWRQRLRLQQDLAKWLHCLIVSNAPGEQRYALKDLRTWIGAVDRPRRFRARLEDAMRELEQNGLIKQARRRPW
ncbi:trfa-related protein, partial [mine drainage metagenome]